VESLLPPPLEGEVRVDSRFVPSTHLGGDMFGYHWLDRGRLALYLLDVSGHGVGSSLLAVSVANLLGAQSLADRQDPGQVLGTGSTTPSRWRSSTASTSPSGTASWTAPGGR
jgi:sigma-B regulation protein RsbU (phosphoserine phosphatase)